MKFVKNAVPSFDKQGVTGSSPVSPILSYKDLGTSRVGGRNPERCDHFVTKIFKGYGEQITMPLFSLLFSYFVSKIHLSHIKRNQVVNLRSHRSFLNPFSLFLLHFTH